MKNKIFFHIDMDSFFVSCERIRRKDLIGKPVGISRNLKRSIVTALSSEAKQKGAKVGEPIHLLKQKVPDIVIVKPDLEFYHLTSIRIFNFIATNFCANIEIYSVDECYIDVTDLINEDQALEFAQEIQSAIMTNIGVPCSIGISYNKFLAKMSTNLAKPHGIKKTNKEDIAKNFYPLQIDKFFMVGKASVPKLKKLGINTIGDFVNKYPLLKEEEVLGNNLRNLMLMISGRNVEKIEKKNSDIKGISNSLTFMEEDIADEEILLNYLEFLCKKISYRLQNHNYEASTIVLLIRSAEKKWISYQTNLKNFLWNYSDIFSVVKNLFLVNWSKERIRGLGIRVTNFNIQSNRIENFSLYNNGNREKVMKINAIVNDVNFNFVNRHLKKAQEKYKIEQFKVKKNQFTVDDYPKIKKIKIKI
ncbi:Y-family DNA polymerase [[Mycoplasma] gypis]|uniref:DNA polymerase IV n=1 Tax=[Mycoplasma] gypis TaxID=92404 RepID=A0ABZ2RN08_9BACT|nr:DNA polymerase IV [[Mycoplasma] gypis]MBN0919165.1 DNA polymerase IV [[Mycoplasma] gypis]